MKTMKLLFLLLALVARAQGRQAGIADKDSYLLPVIKQLQAVWPANRTINLVFHGHSVPAGYWHNHEVHTLESYPYLVLQQLKQRYPYAVINVIITAKGGEHSVSGEERFEKEVLVHRPDVLFLDYALNDRSVGLQAAGRAWAQMISKAQAQGIKVILLTPSPDQRVNILTPGNILAQHAAQIRELAQKYHTGLADPFAQFQKLAKTKGGIGGYMSHVNHPNLQGHQVIAVALLSWF
jgi:acyl-CoA thioesterase-1